MDIDRHTGKQIEGLAAALQGVELIFATAIGERVMRRHFGGGIVEILGRLTRPDLLAAFMTLIAVAIDSWEPRLRVRSVSFTGSVDGLRAGQVSMRIEVDYRPNGHKGDERVERKVPLFVGLSSQGVEVIQ